MKQTNDDENNEKTWDSGITGRQRLFVLNYCTESLCFFNATAAYRESYYDRKTGKRPDDNTAAVCGSKLLRKAKVKNAIRLLLAEVQPEADRMNSYQLLHDLALQATYNPADIIDCKGRLVVKHLAELGEKAKCIAQITPTVTGVQIKLCSRAVAQDKLLKYYNLVKEEPPKDGGMPVLAIDRQAGEADEWNGIYSKGSAVESAAEADGASDVSGD